MTRSPIPFLAASLAIAVAACQGDGDKAHAGDDYAARFDAAAIRLALKEPDAVVEITRRTKSAVCGRFQTGEATVDFVVDARAGRAWRGDRDGGVDALASAACTKTAVVKGAGKGGGEGEGGEKKSGGH